MPTVNTNTIGTGGDFATFDLWEAARASDMPAADTIEQAAYLDEEHDDSAVINDVAWVTDATHYIDITAAAGARHDGTAGSGARVIDSTDGILYNLVGPANHVLVSNLEIGNSNAGAAQVRAIRPNIVACNVDRCIIHGFNNTTTSRSIENVGTTTLTVTNTDFYDNYEGIRFASGGVQIGVLYNNTFWSTVAGSRGLVIGSLADGSDKDIDMRNCLLAGASFAILGAFTTPNKWNAACDQNIVNDGTATTENLPGTFIENATFQAGTGGAGTRVMFVNLTGGSEDLHLVTPVVPADNSALDFGNNLTAVSVPAGMDLTRDIDNEVRPAIGSWDGGADQTTEPVSVCSSGAWSAAVSFLPCDDYRVTIDGPALNQVKISTALEFVE